MGGFGAKICILTVKCLLTESKVSEIVADELGLTLEASGVLEPRLLGLERSY